MILFCYSGTVVLTDICFPACQTKLVTIVQNDDEAGCLPLAPEDQSLQVSSPRTDIGVENALREPTPEPTGSQSPIHVSNTIGIVVFNSLYMVTPYLRHVALCMTYLVTAKESWLPFATMAYNYNLGYSIKHSE